MRWSFSPRGAPWWATSASFPLWDVLELRVDLETVDTSGDRVSAVDSIFEALEK